MKVKDLADKLGLKVLSAGNKLDKVVEGAYCCDLLSWVMSHGNRNNTWITVQVHPNVIAIAVLLEFSCIIIPENIEVENISLQRAEEEGIPVLQSNDNAYVICGKLKELGI